MLHFRKISRSAISKLLFFNWIYLVSQVDMFQRHQRAWRVGGFLWRSFSRTFHRRNDVSIDDVSLSKLGRATTNVESSPCVAWHSNVDIISLFCRQDWKILYIFFQTIIEIKMISFNIIVIESDLRVKRPFVRRVESRLCRKLPARTIYVFGKK